MSDPRLTIRVAEPSDREFILGLTPVLAGVAGLSWHSEETILDFQKGYILKMLDETEGPKVTLIAEQGQARVGFVHACAHEDEISGETCGTVPLLAVSQGAQGAGAGKALMAAAEDWSRDQGHRLLHLEVFHANERGRQFYDRIGFQPDTLVMVKPLSD